VFGEGGCWTRPVKDSDMELMTFLRVAKAVAVPLGRLNYRPAQTSAEAELLILVYWGATEGSRDFDHSDTINQFSRASSASGADAAAQSSYDSALWLLSLANAERDRLDDRNARILGYTESLERAHFAAHMSFAQDIMNEITYNRYYVVLQAYDFRTAAKEKKLKPLWTARISMDEAGKNFSDALDQMLRKATPYLGRDSNGLHRDVTPETRVDLGPLEIIETVPGK
jgi:hypothetical protein